MISTRRYRILNFEKLCYVKILLRKKKKRRKANVFAALLIVQKVSGKVMTRRGSQHL